MDPRAVVRAIEARPSLPSGPEERFAGYAVMGLPFQSGHVLALRRWPASSVGPGYTSVWHRDPAEGWTFYQDVPPEQSCPRYFGPAIARALSRPIDLQWSSKWGLTVRVDEGREVEWKLEFASPFLFQLMNGLGHLLPASLKRRPGVLGMMALGAEHLLGTGHVELQGQVPSGQHFVANPDAMWSVSWSRARVAGQDLGPIGPLTEQVHLEDVWMPQRGVLLAGRTFLEPFDARRHRMRIPVEALPGAVIESARPMVEHAHPA